MKAYGSHPHLKFSHPMKTLKAFSFLISLWLVLFMGREVTVSSFSNQRLSASFKRVVSETNDDRSPDYIPWEGTQTAAHIQKGSSLKTMFGKNTMNPQWVRHRGLRAYPFQGSTFLDSRKIKTVQTPVIYGNLNLSLDATEHEGLPSRAS